MLKGTSDKQGNRESSVKADRDDMPEYLKPRKKEGPWRIVAVMWVVTFAGFGFVSLFDSGLMERSSLSGQRLQQDALPPVQAQPEARNPLESLSANSNSLIVRKGEEPPTATPKPEKQTVFTDQNYKPQGAINVVSARNFGEYVPPVPKTQQQKNPKKVVVVGKADPRISDYCPGGEGSMMRRNCKTHIELNKRNQGLSR